MRMQISTGARAHLHRAHVKAGTEEFRALLPSTVGSPSYITQLRRAEHEKKIRIARFLFLDPDNNGSVHRK